MSTTEQGPQQIFNKAELLYETGPKRQTTLEIRDLLRTPDTTRDVETAISIVATAEEALTYLRVAYPKKIGSVYGRMDILQGLGSIDHPSAQLVVAKNFIAESSLDGSPVVAKTAEGILLDPKRYIHPEALTELLDHEDPRFKELGLQIVEHNPRGGITKDGNVVPSVMQVLHDMITQNEDVDTLKKGAILASLLHERSNGKIKTLRIRAEDILANHIRKIISKVNEPNTFASLVAGIVFTQETAAKTTTNIQNLTLALPPELQNEPEELMALIRLRPIGFKTPQAYHGIVVMYKSLVALMKQRARENLSDRVAQIKDQEARNREKLQAITEATNRRKQLELQEAQERQAQILREQRADEAEFVRKGRVFFPHL